MFLEENFIMWLARQEGLNLKKKQSLIKYFGSAKEVFYAEKSELIHFANIHKINIENILINKSEYILNEYINELYKKNIEYISLSSNKYPYLLSQIPDPPLGIYIKGKLPDDSLKKVSVVGSRKCTQYGATNAYKFSKELSEYNTVIVSGLALGIDSMAHKGAIDGKGKTIAVLGCGVDVDYPQSNLQLKNKVIDNGCVISEFAPQTPPFPTNFPIRNRIISGLSDALIVVEAGKRSGTLITVNQALDQGREVFAVPGNINSSLSQGVNELLKTSAYPLTDISDITQVLGLKIYHDNARKEHYPDLLPEEKIIYECISSNPISIDEIIIKTNLKIQVVQYNLTMLELKGVIQKIAGQKYIYSI